MLADNTVVIATNNYTCMLGINILLYHMECLSGSALAFANHSVDRSLFGRIIYPLLHLLVCGLRELTVGGPIALLIQSLDYFEGTSDLKGITHIITVH